MLANSQNHLLVQIHLNFVTIVYRYFRILEEGKIMKIEENYKLRVSWALYTFVGGH